MKMPFLYRVGRMILGPIFKWYYNPKIINKEYIPKNGSFLICGNHLHLFDQCLAIISTKRYIRYMAKKEYFLNKKVAWFFKHTGCIAVDRKNKNPEAVKDALATLKNGGAIGIFPEGTRNKTNELLLSFKYGAVSMAKKADALIVPFAITGDYVFRSKNLTIIYGEPFKVTDMDLTYANELLYMKVKDLLNKKRRENK